MIVYIDSNYKCHVSQGDGMTAVDTEFFDGKCRQFIEGYRFVPAGETWIREDGQAFAGGMIAPWRDYEILSELQEVAQEEQDKATAEMAALIEEVYNSDLEVIENV